ncbi:hypothetical protein Ssi03_52250 [Sphaerisporangium siamense]|uniref:DUF11 domain-containing protein n=1 Tax=Sphaerisporangium siamense TaxID=795645 RepID=A0A7W7D867_9ACTN|nr:DUF11 domain-containing protein [Sphaerisporangium siamense]MBB4702074.1 hypothetical protein [Sphaerisporangium siamense]GII87235.1 hypothetical protein Ssi03_52250 [Sphaerisporangium siamense]
MRSLRHPLAAVAAAVTMAVTMAVAPLFATPALAGPPEVALSLSSAQVQAGDPVTVTVTVTNVHAFTVLNAAARVFTTPAPLPSYATLTGCAGAAAPCTTVTDGGGTPIGFQAPVGALSGGASATVAFTLSVAPDAAPGERTFQGELRGSNYASTIVTGPVLTVVAEADAAVALTATPRLGLLVPKIDFKVRVTGNGPGAVRDATVTTTLPAGLTASPGDCAAGQGAVTCATGTVPAGSSVTRTFSVPLGLLTIGVPYTFTATRTASDPVDPVSANDSDQVRCTVVSVVLVTCD